MLLPYCPLQASYSVSPIDGMLSTDLDGGAPRTRLDILGGPSTVQCTWVLRAFDFSIFMGFWRNWRASGGVYFDVDLLIDSADVERYQASFIPGNTLNWSKNGDVYTVVAPLWVLPLDKFLDDDDYYGTLAMLIGAYGSVAAALAVLNALDKLVNVDLPYE